MKSFNYKYSDLLLAKMPTTNDGFTLKGITSYGETVRPVIPLVTARLEEVEIPVTVVNEVEDPEDAENLVVVEMKKVFAFTFYCVAGTEDAKGGAGTEKNPWASVNYALQQLQPIVNCVSRYYCCEYVQLKCLGICNYPINYSFNFTNNTVSSSRFYGYDRFIITDLTVNINFSEKYNGLNSSDLYAGIANFSQCIFLKAKIELNIDYKFTNNFITGIYNCTDCVFDNCVCTLNDSVTLEGSDVCFYKCNYCKFLDNVAMILATFNSVEKSFTFFLCNYQLCGNSVFYKCEILCKNLFYKVGLETLVYRKRIYNISESDNCVLYSCIINIDNFYDSKPNIAAGAYVTDRLTFSNYNIYGYYYICYNVIATIVENMNSTGIPQSEEPDYYSNIVWNELSVNYCMSSSNMFFCKGTLDRSFKGNTVNGFHFDSYGSCYVGNFSNFYKCEGFISKIFYTGSAHTFTGSKENSSYSGSNDSIYNFCDAQIGSETITCSSLGDGHSNTTWKKCGFYSLKRCTFNGCSTFSPSCTEYWGQTFEDCGDVVNCEKF